MIQLKTNGQRTVSLRSPTIQPVPPTTGHAAAHALGLRLVAAVNGRLFFSRPVPVRYRTPRTQHITLH